VLSVVAAGSIRRDVDRIGNHELDTSAPGGAVAAVLEMAVVIH
jgi:hypothetical protein